MSQHAKALAQIEAVIETLLECETFAHKLEALEPTKGQGMALVFSLQAQRNHLYNVRRSIIAQQVMEEGQIEHQERKTWLGNLELFLDKEPANVTLSTADFKRLIELAHRA